MLLWQVLIRQYQGANDRNVSAKKKQLWRNLWTCSKLAEKSNLHLAKLLQVYMLLQNLKLRLVWAEWGSEIFVLVPGADRIRSQKNKTQSASSGQQRHVVMLLFRHPVVRWKKNEASIARLDGQHHLQCNRAISFFILSWNTLCGSIKILYNTLIHWCWRGVIFIWKFGLQVKDNVPVNPVGRTGISGRGLLGKWGPNHAADPVVTRYSTDRLFPLKLCMLIRSIPRKFVFA